MDDFYIALVVVIFIFVFCWIFMRCLIFDSGRNNIRGDDHHLDVHRIREQYRNQLVEMVNMQLNLEETNYETDKKIIKSLQEKYKIKINYNQHYEVKKFALKKNKNIHCIICLENYKYNDLIATMKCDHIYHYNCIKKWLNNCPNCPICRKDVIEETTEELILNIN